MPKCDFNKVALQETRLTLARYEYSQPIQHKIEIDIIVNFIQFILFSFCVTEVKEERSPPYSSLSFPPAYDETFTCSYIQSQRI